MTGDGARVHQGFYITCTRFLNLLIIYFTLILPFSINPQHPLIISPITISYIRIQQQKTDLMFKLLTILNYFMAILMLGVITTCFTLLNQEAS